MLQVLSSRIHHLVFPASLSVPVSATLLERGLWLSLFLGLACEFVLIARLERWFELGRKLVCDSVQSVGDRVDLPSHSVSESVGRAVGGEGNAVVPGVRVLA
eukprot:1393730-Amorphochlora_amoeboformis.AAC.3